MSTMSDELIIGLENIMSDIEQQMTLSLRMLNTIFEKSGEQFLRVQQEHCRQRTIVM